MYKGLPKAQGLYDPANEHENCGIGFVAHIKGQRSHDIVKRGLEVLVNMTHRGAEGSDNKSGENYAKNIRTGASITTKGFRTSSGNQTANLKSLPYATADVIRCFRPSTVKAR